MPPWLASPPGQYLLEWERAQMAATVSDIFGFHALQLGLPELNALQANRMPHRWLASEQPDVPGAVLVTDFSALPFPANSLDLVALPHTLELSADPHGVLREVDRVLVPEGRVVICGFNPLSLWGARQRRTHLYRQLLGLDRPFLPWSGEFISPLRLRDWLRLLGLELESTHFGCYRPAFTSKAWLQRFGWMDRIGARWWPILGAVYVVVASKKVAGMTLLNPAWKPAGWLATGPVSVANSAGSTRMGVVRQTIEDECERD